MTPEQKEKEKNRSINIANNKTPSQIIQSQQAQQRYRKNMATELDEIENNRLAESNKNKLSFNRTQKKIYLEEFNSRINGELNEQDWVGPEMDKFHKKMKDLNNYYSY